MFEGPANNLPTNRQVSENWSSGMQNEHYHFRAEESSAKAIAEAVLFHSQIIRVWSLFSGAMSGIMFLEFSMSGIIVCINVFGIAMVRSAACSDWFFIDSRIFRRAFALRRRLNCPFTSYSPCITSLRCLSTADSASWCAASYPACPIPFTLLNGTNGLQT